MATKCWTKEEENILFYSNVNEGEGWKEVNTYDFGYGKSNIKIKPFKGGLSIPVDNYIGGGNYSYFNLRGPAAYNSSTKLLECDLSGFKLNPPSGETAYLMDTSDYNSESFINNLKLPVNYEIVDGIADYTVRSNSVTPSEINLYKAKNFNILCENINIKTAPYLEKLITYSSDISFPNLKSLSSFGKDVTINCPKLTSLYIYGLGFCHIEKANRGLEILNYSKTSLSELTVNQDILIGRIYLEEANIETFKGVFAGGNLSNAFNKCKLLKTVELIILNDVKTWDSCFRDCSKLTNINIDYPSATGSGSYVFTGCTNLIGGKGTTYNSSKTSYDMAKNDNDTPGYFKPIGNKPKHAIKVYNTNDERYDLVYNPYAANNFVCKYIQKDSRFTLDYWVAYKDGLWKNLGSNLTLSLPIKEDVNVIAIPKIAGPSDATFTVDLSAVPSNSCTLTGAGTYKVGDNVVITASPKSGFIFLQWEEKIGDKWILLSNEASYTINAIGRNRVIRAFCVKDTPETAVSLSLMTSSQGTVSGDGRYIKGSEATAKAIPNEGYVFKEWLEDGKQVSTQNPYKFIINKDTTLLAVFASNPYGGGSSGQGGGGGSFDDTSDKIDKDDNSNIQDIITADMNLIYAPTADQVKNLFQRLYNEEFIAVIQSLFDRIGTLGKSPVDWILNCYALPIEVPHAPARNFAMGWTDSGIQMDVSLGRFIHKDMGQVKVEPYWNNALDYKCKVQLYLPYIGYQDLDAATVMNKTLSIKYSVDLLNGDCVAKVYVDGSIHYQFNGNMAYNIPVSQDNFAEIAQQALSTGVNMAAGLATGGASSALNKMKKMTSVEGVANVIGEAAQGANETLTNLNMGDRVARGGNLQSSSGILSVQTPYLLITRPRLAMPANYGHYHGYPANITSKLGNLSGYTELSSIHLEGIPATTSELEELERLLKGGVII